ncbi:phosphoribosylglycinamide formyltransferase [Cyanobacterium stanieri LEGE 03274]|uniref:Phosphoribosylglycinamide formyltransferase n=1 Tax=Cyanobacterium stanieri LEGE 03274 TaxID=1828756 RepID=A0ABR9V350_9CHRO|nr:phosphoribosylglycinamide formyltransferase [Cyanobacterium stanieri]MBE9221979.1 phosphoribosylglycinamide formyltransferase [Cyanobacterium stanieri LEGE 03274]
MSAIISPDVSVEQLKSDIPVSLGVMASGSGSNFEAIARGIINGELNAKIKVLIYNNPDAKVKEKAEKLGIKAVLLNHRDFKTREELDQAIVEVFQNHGVEWVVMAGWMRIITNVLLDAFPRKVINIHPSLLPSFKGINAVEQALKAKVKITGCTVHLVDLAVDSGPILIQSAVPILDDDTPETLHQRIQVQEHLIMVRAIALLPHLKS